ncbi:MAG TPA: L,D-transpeptidase family protein [Chitinophagaceae bacterium]|nr:L,D-transpeptidase family protein [Chitinophagaceae bacterium]
MKNLWTLILFCSFLLSVSAQKNGTSFAAVSTSFLEYQRTLPRPAEAIARKEDTLQKQFAAKKLVWPAKYIYIRSFKYDSQMEVWVKNDIKDPFQLFKTYKICALAGTLGPKRMAGDFQVPEGFYYINEFNPKSNYYLSLGLNYPNVSDRILSDSLQPGGDIYIHGSCVTVGCIPITDGQIDELYILAAHAKDAGQDFIPVHIFPIRYNVKRSSDYLNKLAKDDPSLKQFALRLEDAFDYFEKYRQLPVIMTNERGDYVVDGISRKPVVEEKQRPAHKPVVHRTRDISNTADVVHQWPEFPGGGQAFLNYLQQLGKEMVAYLPGSMQKAYVQVEFVVDADGVPVNFKVIKGVDDDFNDELITQLEKMPTWKPALLNDKAVPKKMKQSIEISAQ